MNVPIKDIKPNVEIIDYNFYIFLFVVFIVVLVSIFLGYKLYKKFKTPNPKKLLIKRLKELDYSNPKKVAYNFAPIAKNLINENNKELFELIENELQKYKYKPNVPPIDEKIKEMIKEFIRLCDES
ncbi:hypothetical protein [Caminibacter pacificus]|jgi:hypothetical protein